MRRILCTSCGTKYLPEGIRQIYPASDEGPAEIQRLVAGKAKQPQKDQRTILINDTPIEQSTDYFECDNCGAQVKPGDRCFAWSVWLENSGPVPKWEHEYLEAQ